MREITYHREGDYFIPALYLAGDEYEKNYNIGKYGYLRLEYLKKHKKADRPYPFNHSGTSSDGSSSQMMFRPQWDQTPMRQLYATPPFVEEERRRRREGLSTSEGNGNKDEK